MPIKSDEQLTHPVTNGKTKQMVFTAMIMLGIGGILGLTFLFVGTFFFAGLTLWLFKAGMVSLSASNFGGLVYAIHSFFDTREAEVKEKDKISKRVAKYEHKEEMYRMKNRLESHKKK